MIKMKIHLINSISIIILLSLTSCMKVAEPELHIFNEGFQGYVIIIFDDNQGKEVKYINGYRVYEIPSDGILRTKFKLQTGWIPNDKLRYSYDPNGQGKFIECKVIEGEIIDSISNCIHNKEISDGMIRYIVSPLNKIEFYYNNMRNKVDELFLL